MVTAKEIPPGGVGEVKVTFRTKGYQGKIKKSVTVETNDSENQRVALSVGGEVVADVMVEPRYINFRNVSKENPAQPIQLEISLREGKGLKIRSVSADNPSIVLKEQKKTGNQAAYTVSLAENVPVGRLTGKIVVDTNSRQSPKIQIPFYAFVQGRVTVTPQLLSFGVIPPGEPSRREITLRGTGDRGFSVERVTATTDLITTEVVPEPEGGGYRILVTYDPKGKTRGRVSEKLTILVEDGGEEILEVPVYGTIHEAPKSQASP